MEPKNLDPPSEQDLKSVPNWTMPGTKEAILASYQ